MPPFSSSNVSCVRLLGAREPVVEDLARRSVSIALRMFSTSVRVCSLMPLMVSVMRWRSACVLGLGAGLLSGDLADAAARAPCMSPRPLASAPARCRSAWSWTLASALRYCASACASCCSAVDRACERLTERRLVALLELLLGDVVLRHRLVGRRAVLGVVEALRRQRRGNDGRGRHRRGRGAGCFGLERRFRRRRLRGRLHVRCGFRLRIFNGPAAASFCVASCPCIVAACVRGAGLDDLVGFGSVVGFGVAASIAFLSFFLNSSRGTGFVSSFAASRLSTVCVAADRFCSVFD